MSRKLFGVLCASALLWSLMGPAGAVGEGPTYRNERVYFHCTEPTKVHNVNFVYNDFAPATWNTTAPSQSVQAGAGCGSADPTFFNGDEGTDAAWEGTFTGNLRSMTVELHNIYVGGGRATGQVGIKATLTVEGVAVPLDNANLIITTVPSSTKLSEKVLFTIKGLNYTEDLDDIPGPDDGPGTKVRDVRLQIHASANLLGSVSAWVWDTTEVPAGITFNNTTDEAAVLNALQ